MVGHWSPHILLFIFGPSCSSCCCFSFFFKILEKFVFLKSYNPERNIHQKDGNNFIFLARPSTICSMDRYQSEALGLGTTELNQQFHIQNWTEKKLHTDKIVINCILTNGSILLVDMFFLLPLFFFIPYAHTKVVWHKYWEWCK